MTTTESGIILVGILILFIADFLQNRVLQEGKTIVDILLKRNLFIRWSVIYLLIFMVLLFGRFGLGNTTEAFMYAFY